MKPTALIVEDDRRIAELVAKNLEAAGFATRCEYEGTHVPSIVGETQPSVVVLDVMLPGIDGLELTRRIRRRHDVPILLLTARREEADKVLGFEIGADDYLTKPFSTRELVARVRALVRRATGSLRDETLVRGELTIDAGRREARRGDDVVPLTSLEFDLLWFLAARPGRVFSREALMEHVWGEGRVVDDRSIDSLVSRLRRKVERDPAKPRHIVTVWGAGYRFSESG